MKFYFLFNLIFLISFTQVNSDDSNLTLDQISLMYHANRSSQGHNYISIYENYFKNLRNKPIKLLEIGFLQGESARVWERYFPNAEIHFLDINKEFYEKYGKGLSSRCHLHLIDQGNKNELMEFIKNNKDFDIIIDDGGHMMHQQIISFEVLFPYLKNNGIYIIEDLHTSYWKEFGGTGVIAKTLYENTDKKTTVRFLQELIDDVNYVGAKTSCANKLKCPKQIYEQLNYYQKNIKSMHFYDSICIILKDNFN